MKDKNTYKSYFLVIAVWCVCVWPADVVNGNVSELLVHGWLVFPVWQDVEGGLRMFIGHIYPNFSCALKKSGNNPEA